jgi:hypothetical protein
VFVDAATLTYKHLTADAQRAWLDALAGLTLITDEMMRESLGVACKAAGFEYHHVVAGGPIAKPSLQPASDTFIGTVISFRPAPQTSTVSLHLQLWLVAPEGNKLIHVVLQMVGACTPLTAVCKVDRRSTKVLINIECPRLPPCSGAVAQPIWGRRSSNAAQLLILHLVGCLLKIGPGATRHLFTIAPAESAQLLPFFAVDLPHFTERFTAQMTDNARPIDLAACCLPSLPDAHEDRPLPPPPS